MAESGREQKRDAMKRIELGPGWTNLMDLYSTFQVNVSLSF